jgi:hypothetical protein
MTLPLLQRFDLKSKRAAKAALLDAMRHVAFRCHFSLPDASDLAQGQDLNLRPPAYEPAGLLHLGSDGAGHLATSRLFGMVTTIRAGLLRLQMTKAAINAPTRSASDPFYPAECRLALEPSFQSLADKAVEAGWTLSEVSFTIMMLAAKQLELYSTDAQDQSAAH